MIGYRTPSEVVDPVERAKLPRVDRETISVGDLVTISSRGEVGRVARVTKVSRERLYTEYTTPSALKVAAAESARLGRTVQPTVTRKPVRIDDDWIRFYARREPRVLPGRSI